MDLLGKAKNFFSRINDKLPDNWKYYTETFIGSALIISSIGSFFFPPTSIPSGIAFLLTGLYTVPDIRFRLLYRIDVRPPRYSLIAVLLLGFLIGGMFSPTVNSSAGSAEFVVLSSNLEVETDKPRKIVTGTAEVQNQGGIAGNYSAGLSVDNSIVNESTVSLDSGESKEFKFSAVLEEQGTHEISFYSSPFDTLDLDNTDFQIDDSVEVPFYFNSENIRSVVQSYSKISKKDLGNILYIDISESESGTEVTLVNKPEATYGVSDLMTVASANSFFASKKIFQEFETVSYVNTITKTDYTHSDGSIEERTVLETGLSSEDAASIDWEKATSDVRVNYRVWLNMTSDYSMPEDFCESLSSDVDCSK